MSLRNGRTIELHPVADDSAGFGKDQPFARSSLAACLGDIVSRLLVLCASMHQPTATAIFDWGLGTWEYKM